MNRTSQGSSAAGETAAPASRREEPGQFLGERQGLRLRLVARPRKDIGAVIRSIADASCIQGVELQALATHADDRGYFRELVRVGATPMTHGLAQCPSLQVSMALSYPGIIKALHYHFLQTDYWAPVHGMLQVVLWDLREGSPTHGEVNTLYAGTHTPWLIKIPPGVGHGYKVVGTEAATLIYLTDRFYNPEDEGRLEYNHPSLNYDWELQHK